MKMRALYIVCLSLCLAAASCGRHSGTEAALRAGFAEPSEDYRPWCYWWWQNGNVDKETIATDLETMKDMGFGGLLLVDSRGYWDDDDHVRIPAPAMEFMSEEWIDHVSFALRKADSLGLKVTLNLSSSAGSLKGPWAVAEDAPKQLVYQSFRLPAGQCAEFRLPESDLPHFQDVALFAVRYEGAPRPAHTDWKLAGDDSRNLATTRALEVVELTGRAKDGLFSWDVPQGQWMLLRFGWSTIPGYEYDVDILDPAAVTRHFDRIIQPFGRKPANLYTVSWEGAVPNWSPQFEEDFRKFSGYPLRPLMPMLAGFETLGEGSQERFMRDYCKARNDMFRQNFYLTMRDLAHGCGLGMISESGGPWKRSPAIFQEADQLEFLAVNDMPQGEFWLNGRTHLKGAVATAHMYGLPKASAEAFTHMSYHWSVYPFVMKEFADQAFADGINHFVWHTFTCTPEHFGVPGPDYFAGTHLNRNVTWAADAGPFIKYLARCQYLLQQGMPVVDIAVWAGDRVYQGWGHYRDKPYDASSVHLPAGYNSDLMNTDVLLNRAKAKGGRLVLPDGMSYSALVLDPEFPEALTAEVQEKVAAFRKAGVPVFDAGDSLALALLPDFEGCDAVAHRRIGSRDIYFVAGEGDLSLTFRAKGRAQIWDAVTGTVEPLTSRTLEDGRSSVELQLPEKGSAFVVFDAEGKPSAAPAELCAPDASPVTLKGPWEVSFRYHKLDTRPPSERIWQQLKDLTTDVDDCIRHFSGTATLRSTIRLTEEQAAAATVLSLGRVVGGLAHVYVNGVDCGTVWTAPWEAGVAGLLKPGDNEVRIDFTNTWQNLLIGDCSLREAERLTRSALQYYNYPRTKIPGAWMRPTVYSGYSAYDSLCPNGVLGPVVFRLTPAGCTGEGSGQAIPFEHPLPAQNIDGRHNGTYNNVELAIPGVLTTLDTDLGMMMKWLRDNVQSGRHTVFVEGQAIPTYKNWIRDHVHTMKAFRHWEYNLRSYLDFTIAHQRRDGSYYELIKQMDDPHWSFVAEDDVVFFPEDNLYLARLDIESDIEYLVVEGAAEYYKATADRRWLRHNLPKLEKGIQYSTSNPKRWEPELGLVKRAYTIDTWDFTYLNSSITDRRITGDTPMAVMHGDNSGVYQAMRQLAWMNEELGHRSKARQWREEAEGLRQNAITHLWNGKYFTHQLPLGCQPVDDKEDIRLTLSNAYDINRGFTTLEQSRSIVEEYMHRRDTTSAFAEWFTIDPPYEPWFGEVKVHPANTYINGCVTSFTAGELAKAAFSCGHEAYGWDILRRVYEQMVEDGGNIYFLYNRFTKKPEDAKVGPAAWGAAAVLSAIDEGLAGIEDLGCRYRRLGFSPRWPVTPYKELRYFSGYEVNGDVVDVRYILTGKGMRYCVDSPAREISAHILLPEGASASTVLLNGKPVEFRDVLVGDSHYIDFSARGLHGRADIEILF